MAEKVEYKRKPNRQYQYLRVCDKCGDKSWVTYRPNKNAVCYECSKKAMVERWTKKEGEKVKYWYFCPNCLSVRKIGEKRKSALCGTCNKKKTKKGIQKYFFDFELMKVRTLFVKPVALPKKRKKRVQQKKKKKYGGYIDPIVLEKTREKNRLHKEAEENKEVTKKIVQRKTDEQMIAEFLQNNEPSVKADNRPINKILTQGEMYINPRLEFN